jgi:hypothetical protein
MKTFLFYTLVILTVTTTFAQNHAEIHTKSLKIENFIDYVAAQAINPIEQRIYIALEIGPNGLQAEERFYIEQGIKLLSKRVTENSLIAIGTYGSKSTIILPYSTLNATIIAHAHKTSNPGATDGIDLAYETAELQIKEGVKNIVLILRNNSTQAALGTTTSPSNATAPQIPLEQVTKGKQAKIGGAIALTALTILPDILEIIKN